MHLDEAMAGTPEGSRRSIAQPRWASKASTTISRVSHGTSSRGPWMIRGWMRAGIGCRRMAWCCAPRSPVRRATTSTTTCTTSPPGRVLARFAGLSCHLAMGIPVQFFAAGDRWDLPDAYEALLRRDGFFTELMFPITWGGRWDYPYREAHPLILTRIAASVRGS